MTQHIAKIGHWQYDPATETITWSEEVYRMYGRSVEQGPLALRDYEQVGSAETLARLRESFRLAVAEGKPYDIVIRLEFPHRGAMWLRSICKPEDTPGPEGHFLRGVVQDVTEQMEVQRALERERTILHHAEVLANVGAWEWDMLHDRWSFSPQWRSIHGVGEEQLSTDVLMRLAHPEDADRVQAEVTRAREHGDAYDLEHRIVRADTGEVRVIRAVGEVDRSPVHGGPVRMYGIAQDITAYRQAERELRQSLTQNQRLMYELNHRVKNNLALVASMIRLRQRQSGGEVDLSDLAARVEAIMIVHQQLQQSDTVGQIPVEAYLSSLLSVVFEQWSGPAVNTVVRVGELSLDPKTVTTLGLVINELATNAIKYGFPNDPHPRFSVTGGPADDSAALTLQVENSGAPFPAGLQLAGAETLGLRLVSDLMEQLNGTVDLQRSPHPVFTLRFPLSDGGGGRE
jgi:PAS domain S-box-containing protein